MKNIQKYLINYINMFKYIGGLEQMTPVNVA